MAVVFLHFGFLFLQGLHSQTDVAVNGLRFLAKGSHCVLKVVQKCIHFLFPWVYLNGWLSSIDFHDCESLACQQNSAFFAIIQGFLLAIGQVFCHLMRIIDAHEISLATKVWPSHQARFSASWSQRRKWSLGSNTIGSVANVHLIWNKEAITFPIPKGTLGVCVDHGLLLARLALALDECDLVKIGPVYHNVYFSNYIESANMGWEMASLGEVENKLLKSAMDTICSHNL